MEIIQHEDGTYTGQWKCACGIDLETHSNDGGRDIECECGRWFNCFGQQLQDPHYGYDDY